SHQLAAWAKQSGSIGALLTAHRARVIDLLAAGDLAAMDNEVLAFRRIAEPLGAPNYRWWPALWSAMRALLAGSHDLAEERGAEALHLAERAFPAMAFLNFSFLLFFLRREQGRLDEMEPAMRDMAAAQADIPAIRAAFAFLLAEIGKLDEARGIAASLNV